MKRLLTTGFFLLPLVFSFAAACGGEGTIAPIISTEWLEENLDLENLVIIDIRSAGAYAEGHIPKAVNVPLEMPFSAWTTTRNGLLVEVPDDAGLFSMIGACGINGDSLVVIVAGSAETAPPSPPVYATRAACTLIYAGIENVAILDGGFSKWAAEKRVVTDVLPTVKPVAYNGKVNQEIFVSQDYLKEQLKKAVIIDTRDPAVYFGVKADPNAPKAGHIPAARSLPASWLWNEDGTFKSREVLDAMAAGVIGKQGKEEVILYCSTGTSATSWWFVLSRVLGYEKVRLYDGSANEWGRNNEMVRYTWSE